MYVGRCTVHTGTQTLHMEIHTQQKITNSILTRQANYYSIELNHGSAVDMNQVEYTVFARASLSGDPTALQLRSTYCTSPLEDQQQKELTFYAGWMCCSSRYQTYTT